MVDWATWIRNNRVNFDSDSKPEFLLVDADSSQPLWHRDLSFKDLNALLEEILLDGVHGAARSLVRVLTLRSKAVESGRGARCLLT